MAKVIGARSRLESAKGAVLEFIEARAAVDPAALVAVVAYNQTARVVSDLSPARRWSSIAASLSGLAACGDTCITLGLELADALLRASPGGARADVVLLTDGYHNVGGDPREPAASLRSGGHVISTVGIGANSADVQEALLKAIASTGPDGRPRYRFITDPDDLNQHFADIGGSLTL